MARTYWSKALLAGSATVGVGGLLVGVGAAVAARSIWKAFRSVPSLNGKVVLITGGSRGLGLALAEECAKQGCQLAICGRNQQSLTHAERVLKDMNAEVLALRCDVTQRDEIEQMINQVIAHYGKIDVLINNAGIISVGPLQAQTPQDFQQAMDVMFWGAVHTTLLVLPHMQARHQGRIANITSIGGKMAVMDWRRIRPGRFRRALSKISRASYKDLVLLVLVYLS